MAQASVVGAVRGWFRSYPFAPRYRDARLLALRTEDGVRLAAWHLVGPADAPMVVVLVHGFVNWSRTPAVHRFASRLRRSVHVIVPDLRGHGRSEGLCSLGRDEALDVDAAVAAARAAHPGVPVVTVGVSLGGAAALLHAGTRRGVDAVVAVSAPAWAGDATRPGAARVARYASSRAGRAVLAGLTRTRLLPGCDGLADAPEVMPAIAPAFVLVVHDPEDWYFSIEHAETLHRLAREPKALWIEPGAGHGTDLLTDDFAERLLAELRPRVSPPRAPSR